MGTNSPGDKWYDSEDPERFARGAGWFGLKWTTVIVIAVLVLSALIGAGAFVFNVTTSDVKGRGDAIIQKNSALNRTQAQAQFQANVESIRSLDQRLSDAKVQLDDFNKSHPSVGNGTPYDPIAEQQANLALSVRGLQQQCRIAVADYNARSSTYTLRDFRDADLPFKIERSDPAFTSKFSYADFDCLPALSQ